MTRKARLTDLAMAAAIFLSMPVAMLATVGLPTAAVARDANPFVTAWATSQQGLGQAKISNATVRMIARVTLAGDSVRVRLDNTFGTAPVTFGKATVGLARARSRGGGRAGQAADLRGQGFGHDRRRRHGR